MAGESKTAIIAATAGNLAIAIVKFIASAVSGSAAMLSEAIHSLVDTANDALMLYGLHASRKPADDEHPFGYGHELYFWTLVVGILFFAVGGGMSIVTGIGHIRAQEAAEPSVWNYAVIGIAVVFEAISWHFGFNAFRKEQRGRGIVETIQRSKDPTTFSVMLEDSAALIGLALAFAGIFLSDRLGVPWIDGASSILIGLLLCVVAIVMVFESKSLLVGEGVDKRTAQDLRALIGADPAVTSIGRIATLYMGPDDVILALEIRFHGEKSTADTRHAIARLTRAVQERYPRMRHVFLDASSIGE